MHKTSFEKISMVGLVLLITGAIDNVRNLPTTALFGSSLIFFFLLSTLVFLIPVALVAAELSSAWSDEEGGIFSWVHEAFGRRWAFFTIWLQWINTLVWYPTILSFIAGTLAYLINPELAQSKWYLLGVILTVFWSLTLLGLSGLRASAKFSGLCAIIGMIMPIILLIVFAIAWIYSGHPQAIHFHLHNLVPKWDQSQSWSSLTAIITSFLGMELAAVHVRNINEPQHNFPRALLFSVILIVLTMILGSLAIAIALPKQDISLVQGVLQTYTTFFKAFHLSYLLPILVFVLLMGSLGNMINWIISPAKGLLMAAEHRLLPAWFGQLNKQGVASRILLLQAVIVTIICGLYLLLQSINEIYWLLTALSTELYVIMYVMMFFAAIYLKHKHQDRRRYFVIPGGKTGYYLTCALGLIGCFITLVVGFSPPPEALAMGGVTYFRILFSAGIITMITPVFVILYVTRAE